MYDSGGIFHHVLLVEAAPSSKEEEAQGSCDVEVDKYQKTEAKIQEPLRFGGESLLSMLCRKVERNARRALRT